MVSPFLPPAPTPPVNNGNPAIAANRDRNAGLLNLLKFSSGGQSAQAAPPHAEPQHHDGHGPPATHHQMPGPPSSYPPQQAQDSQPSQQEPREEHVEYPTSRQQLQTPLLAPAPSGADPSGLLAALMRGMRDTDEEPQENPPEHHPSGHAAHAAPPAFGQSTPPSNTRAYLLNLLNQPKPSQDDQYNGESHPSNLTSQSGEPAADPARAVPPPELNYGPAPGMPAYEYEQRMEPQRAPSYRSYNSQESHGPAANASFPPTNRGSGMDWPPGYNQSPEQHASQASYGHSHSSYQSAAASYQILKKPQPSESPAGSMDRAVGYHDSPALSQDQVGRRTEYAISADETLVDRPPGSSEFYSNNAILDKAAEVHLGDGDANEALESTERESPAERLAEEAEVEAENAKDFDDALDASSKRSPDFSPKYHTNDENSDSQDQYEDSNEETRGVSDKLQAVADSWDSADAEDGATPEEGAIPPITVYNFPMQPWISIVVASPETEERPEFREGAIMDIARLKKDFDQIDRNLYTASQHCMAYGMSKAGGMHVIRQDDGKDVKVFSNTKDRIFNISMSVTPQDHFGRHREAIMGTGVSGTVYWVQILEGDKDHIEDAHPEQYGFALPPLSSQEGDTSGGVLKTRARVSSCHPEFFAVGRGKSITIVWPHLVMREKQLFKAGHDRVVDAEKLAKHCSLKINTGKAGKDFTFSQDDSVIVSLDKSGRVKFWDVRDLTAASEDSDPNSPVPAHTSMEIKDPLMTLASTPEGEKAWPTSVLLLDKIKPYQKRCALRYMIVGMKQNHTLQLWDLALGKPVQEFNLPHSKESDAVCSVSYNPASGMIVIGHPTRNSIYMAHLSAPRYSFKNISQADYILRLGARDATIPAPESTAVISGMREYSFANKGILRSLDMLSNPAMPQDGEEPTLFELYAMHSKGVACILARQGELGWSKDNKVVRGIDAVQTGVISVSPLKPLGPQPVDEPVVQTKPAPRPGKDSTVAATQQDESPKKPVDSASPVKIQPRKDADHAAAPAATAGAAPERTEKRGRKGKKAAAALAAAADAQANGATTSGGPKSNAAAAKGGDSGRGSAASQKAAAPSITQEAIETTVKNMEARLHASVSGVVESAFGGLSKTILSREADFDSRQLKLLDVVSDVLNQNVQGVLGDIISKQFSGSVIPSIADATSRAAADQVSAKAVHVIQKELNKSLPNIGEKVLMNEALVDALCDKIGARVVSRVQDEVMHSLTANLIPAVTNVTVQTSHRVAGEIQQQYQGELDRMDAQRRADANKVDQLLALVTRLSDTVSTMAATQSQFQGEFLKFQQQQQQQQQQTASEREHTRQGPPASIGSATQSPSYMMRQAPQPPLQPQQPQQPHHQHQPQQQPQPHQQHHQHQQQHHQQQQQHHQQHHQSQHHQGPPLVPHDSPSSQPAANTEAELNRQIGLINQSVRERRLEEAIIRWLQSGHEDEIFSRFWSNLSPVYLRDLPPLVLLSVATTVSQHLETALARQKTAWLEMSVHCLLNSVPAFDQQVREVTPNIMKLVISRSETMLMRVSAKDGLDPLLKNLSQLISTAKRIVDATTNDAAY